VDAERKVVLEEIAMRDDDPSDLIHDLFLEKYYGDTPLGMVESALEFLRICEDEKYHEIVISMKSSNTQVMVQAYRLLVQKLNEGGFKPYPLHLGVTEAGEAEDGRNQIGRRHWYAFGRWLGGYRAGFPDRRSRV